LEGEYFPAQGGQQKVSGSTEVVAHEQFPETLRVVGEVRDAGDPLSRPVATEFALDLAAPKHLRFHMDSIPLGTVLLGEGVWNPQVLLLTYGSPDRRILGSETYVAAGETSLFTSGILAVDGVVVTRWLAKLQRLP
jgi:hypothetical protein